MGVMLSCCRGMWLPGNTGNLAVEVETAASSTFLLQFSSYSCNEARG